VTLKTPADEEPRRNLIKACVHQQANDATLPPLKLGEAMVAAGSHDAEARKSLPPLQSVNQHSFSGGSTAAENEGMGDCVCVRACPWG
jgi:hypothetical protein